MASAQRLLKAKNLISDYLTEANAEHTHPTKWLEQLYSKVADQLQFSLYEVEEESEVGVIFEVMNDRGKQLTNLEKVKNYLLYAASALNITPDNKKTLTDSVNQAWAGILKQLMAANLGSPANENQLLRANWLMEYDPQPRNWQGSKKHPRQIRPSQTGPQPAVASAARLCRGAPQFLHLLLRCVEPK